MNLAKKQTPKDRALSFLFDYQREAFSSPARFFAANWCRQSGKDFTFAAKLVADAYLHAGSGHMIAAPSERQSLDTLAKCKMWVEAFELEVAEIIDAPAGTESPNLLSKTIRLSNGSEIRAVPGKPDTVRGFTGSVWLTEVAFFENPAETWAAILPTITSTLSGRKTAHIWSTPNGKDNFFYPIFRDAALGAKSIWTTSTKTIFSVVEAQKKADASPVNIDELHAAFAGMEDKWRQEFLCEFLDGSSVLFAYDDLFACESPDCPQELDRAILESAERNFYVGVDVGRKRDLTVIWIAELVSGILTTVGVITLEKTPFREQREILFSILSRRSVRRACIDATGLGMELAEAAVEAFGAWKVEACTFGNEFKNQIFLKLKNRFDDRSVRIPRDSVIREDIHAVQKETTKSGNVRVLAPRNADGHSDRATALALCCEAASLAQAGNSHCEAIDIAGAFRAANPKSAWRKV